jgi:nucleotide-binding universal stress UspA family protein
VADLLGEVVVPVADEEVAEETARIADDYLDDDGRVVLVHVVREEDEYASEDEWETFAERAFESARAELDGIEIETEILHGEAVAETVVEYAAEIGATAVAFRSRGGSRWRQIMAGDVARELVTSAELPIVVLPALEDGDD